MFTAYALVFFILVFALAFCIVVLAGHHLATAVMVGVWWAGGAQGLAWGIAEVGWPGWVIRQRQQLMQGSKGVQSAVGDQFSAWFGIRGEAPWESGLARRRVRCLGAVLVVIWAVILLGSVLAVGPLDRALS